MSTVHLPDYVQVDINGTDRTEYIISYERKSSICEIGDSFILEISPEYPTDLDPYDDVVIREQYGGSPTRVLKGYTLSIGQSADPGSFVVEGMDKATLLHDYFIGENLTSSGESVDFWIDELVGLTGLDVQFDATSPATVPPGTPLGFQTVAEAIQRLERMAAYYIKYDSVIDKVKAFRLETSEPQMSVNEALEAERSLGTENTRNVVKVYGGFKYNLLTEKNEQVFAAASAQMSELVVDKTVVVSNPALRKVTYAHIVARRILDVVNSVDDEQVYLLEGFYPDIQVADVANISWHQDWEYDGSRVITSITARVSQDGAATDIVFGEKCPRLSISLPPSPVLASTISGGVGISWDGGSSFSPSNIGLMGSSMNVTSIAANNYGQQMITTHSGIYRRSAVNGAWTLATDLPDPENAENRATPFSGGNITVSKVVEEPNNFSTFHVAAGTTFIGSGQDAPFSGDTVSRSWVYTTKDLGNSWVSKQLYNPQTFGSGQIWNVAIRDIESSPINNVTVLTEDFFKIEINPTGKYWITGFSAEQSTSFHERRLITSTENEFDQGSAMTYWRTLPDNRSVGYTFDELSFPDGVYELRRWNTAWDSSTIVRPWSGDLTTDELGYAGRPGFWGVFAVEENPDNTPNLAWNVTWNYQEGTDPLEVLWRLETWFFNDDLSETNDYNGSAVKSTYSIETFPKTYTTSDPLRDPSEQFTATGGKWVDGAPDSDIEDGDWNNLGLARIGEATNAGNAAGTDRVFSTTSDIIFHVEIGANGGTGPTENNTGEHFPGDMQIFTMEFNVATGTVVATGKKLIEEWLLDSSPFNGPLNENDHFGYDGQAPNPGTDGIPRAVYKSTYGHDGNGTFYFGISLISDEETTNPYAKTWLFSCKNGNISDPIGPIDWSDEWGDGDVNNDMEEEVPFSNIIPTKSSTYPGVFIGTKPTAGGLFVGPGTTVDAEDPLQARLFTPTAGVTKLPGSIGPNGAAYSENGVSMAILLDKPAEDKGITDIIELPYGSASYTMYLSDNNLQRDMFRHPDGLEIAASGATT